MEQAQVHAQAQARARAEAQARARAEAHAHARAQAQAQAHAQAQLEAEAPAQSTQLAPYSAQLATPQQPQYGAQPPQPGPGAMMATQQARSQWGTALAIPGEKRFICPEAGCLMVRRAY